MNTEPIDLETVVLNIMQNLRPAYTVAEWGKACGVGETTVRQHEKANNIVFRYPNSKPIVFIEDGFDWLRSLPTESPSERRAS